MDSSAVLLIALVALAWASFHVLSRFGRRKLKLPPGPYPFPIIGNILQLGSNPNQSLANLSKTYGPLMSLRLGRQIIVVASSPEAAKQVLKQHDPDLCSRAITSALEAQDFANNSFGFLPVANSIWKKARKVCREHLFSAHSLDKSQGLRQEKLAKLRRYLHECSAAGRVVDVGEAVFTTSINLMTATLFSVELATYESDVAQDLKGMVEGMMKALGATNIADFFPFLKPFDPQGIKKEAGFYMAKLSALFDNIIDRRLQSRGTHVDYSKKFDLLETLLNLKEEGDGELTLNSIKCLFMDLFFGQSHTTTTTVEWAMTELILNPEKMAKAKNELKTVIDKNKQVEESDIPRLPYLHAVIKETLRLHPPGSFLIPRKADYEVEINGYTIPKDAQIFVNVWAIGRDSSVWRNSTSFEPERFFNNKLDYRGRDFEFLPFGSGRRVCPGITLADRMLPLMIASFIHNFDWKLENGVKLDTNEKYGIALRKADPLMAIPIQSGCE